MQQYVQHDHGFISSPQILRVLLRLWVQHYTEFAFEVFERESGKVIPFADAAMKAAMPHIYSDERINRLNTRPLDTAWAVERINSGDCGTTAIAVSHVYDEIMNGLVTRDDRVEAIQLVDNYNHAFLQLGELYYDTLKMDGESDLNAMYEMSAENCNVERLTTEEIFRRYIWKDRIGNELIRRFCQRFHVAPPAVVLDLAKEPQSKDKDGIAWMLWVADRMLKLPALRDSPDDYSDGSPDTISSMLDDITASMDKAASDKEQTEAGTLKE